MSNRDFVPGGLTKLQIKDLDNVLAEAGDLKLPVVQHIRDRFHRYMVEMDGGDRDHAGLFEELRDLNGLTRSE
jgi:2-hydroxy-3-oxopropionate reductase